MAALQGNFLFQAPRRYTLDYLSRTQDVWSYLWKRNKQVPILGSFHGNDLQAFYDLTGNSDWTGSDALINFACNERTPRWLFFGRRCVPVGQRLVAAYERQNPQLLTFEDPKVLTLTNEVLR